MSRATLSRNKKNKITLRWSFILKWTKRLLKYGEERSVVGDCTHEEKNEDFTRNGSYGNQSHLFELILTMTLSEYRVFLR